MCTQARKQAAVTSTISFLSNYSPISSGTLAILILCCDNSNGARETSVYKHRATNSNLSRRLLNAGSCRRGRFIFFLFFFFIFLILREPLCQSIYKLYQADSFRLQTRFNYRASTAPSTLFHGREILLGILIGRNPCSEHVSTMANYAFITTVLVLPFAVCHRRIRTPVTYTSIRGRPLTGHCRLCRRAYR